MIWTVRRGNEVGHGPILAKKWGTDDGAEDDRFWIEDRPDGHILTSEVWSSPSLKNANAVVDAFEVGGVESYVWLAVMDAPKLIYRSPPTT